MSKLVHYKYMEDPEWRQYTREQILLLSIAEANELYRETSASLISDQEYDFLVDELAKTRPEIRKLVGTALTYDKVKALFT